MSRSISVHKAARQLHIHIHTSQSDGIAFMTRAEAKAILQEVFGHSSVQFHRDRIFVCPIEQKGPSSWFPPGWSWFGNLGDEDTDRRLKLLQQQYPNRNTL
jgi:hypothetical protein